MAHKCSLADRCVHMRLKVGRLNASKVLDEAGPDADQLFQLGAVNVGAIFAIDATENNETESPLNNMLLHVTQAEM